MKLKFFAPILKIDEEQRLVYGVLAEEAVDKDGEIFDYAASKKYFENWNASYAEQTDGESVGNMREMHGKSAAGKFVDMIYDDAKKTISVVAKVVDDMAWKKVLEKVYTGFSIGARRVGKSSIDKVTGAIRWVADPFEGSLVDNPCMYGAKITMVKADGTSVEEEFAAKNTGEKCLFCIGDFAYLVARLGDLACSFEYEAQYEGDKSPIPAKVRDLAKQLGAVLVDYAAEEVQEASAVLDAVAGISTEEEKSMKKIIAEPGERPAEKHVETPASKTVETPAAEAPKTEGEKVVKISRKQLLAAMSAMLATEEDAVNVNISEETVVAVPEAGKAAVAPVTKIEGEVVTKAEFDVMKSENDALKADFKQLNEKLTAMLKSPIPSPVKLKGSALVGKELDTPEKSVAGEDHVEDKATNPKDAILKIHAAGPQR